MNERWKSIVVTEIGSAVYVAPNTGKPVHRNRPFHAFVLNDETNDVKEYRFHDGQTMKTEANSLFYLPKGSSYQVHSLKSGGCYVVNFDADICDEPFSVRLRNMESALHNFKTAADAWKSRSDARRILSMRAVYDAVFRVQRELQKQYASGTQLALIAPAVEAIHRSFTESDLSISRLASLCGISEVYFRRLFLNAFGVSPKEYMIHKRLDYAKSLLRSGNFSVVDVAYLCGYRDPCHFSRDFARRVGVPPSKYS